MKAPSPTAAAAAKSWTPSRTANSPPGEFTTCLPAESDMPDLSVEFCGVQAPNPFWLASAPPTNSEYQVRRAFDAGWGGAVWKTLGHEPIVNVSSRYGAIDYDGRKILGLNNIELITDRTLDDNLREIARIKNAYPGHALFVSLMVESNREAWHEITKRTQDTGADGIE